MISSLSGPAGHAQRTGASLGAAWRMVLNMTENSLTSVLYVLVLTRYGLWNLRSAEVESHVLLDEVLPWAVLAPFGQNNIASALSQVASNFPYLLTVMACGYFPLRWTRNYFENMDYFGSNFH